MPPALTSMAPPPQPDTGALQSFGAPNGVPQPANAPQPQQRAMPAPTHAQTVAALRHLIAIQQQLGLLLKNPDLGKADVKSSIIDGMTKLVAERMIAPGQAVAQLAAIPDRPYDQKVWAQTQMQQITQARNVVLAHHAMAFPGGGTEATPDADSHMADLAAMMQAHYGKGGNA